MLWTEEPFDVFFGVERVHHDHNKRKCDKKTTGLHGCSFVG